MRIGPIAYKLELPSHLRKMHNLFHVSMLRKYVPNPSHILKIEILQVSKEGVLQVKPFFILDHQVHQLRNHEFKQVKVQWDQYSPESATWEDEMIFIMIFLIFFIKLCDEPDRFT